MRGVTATAIASLLVTQASAAGRQSLPGFQKFQFGMSEQDIRRITKIQETSVEKEGLWLNGAQPIDVDGVSYHLRVLLNDGKLHRVRLSNETAASDGACETNVARVFGVVQAKYGEPDEPPERDQLFGGISTLRTAKFTFRDGAQITSSALHQDGNCTVLVGYTAGKTKGGSSF